MSEEEQAAIYLRLKKQSKQIQNEIAALEAEMIDASRHFRKLAEDLEECRAGNASWDTYAKILSNLPKKVARYEELQVEKAETGKQLGKFTDMD